MLESKVEVMEKVGCESDTRTGMPPASPPAERASKRSLLMFVLRSILFVKLGCCLLKFEPDDDWPPPRFEDPVPRTRTETEGRATEDWGRARKFHVRAREESNDG